MDMKNNLINPINKINLNKLAVIFLSFHIIMAGFIVALPKTKGSLSWPTTWTQYDTDPNENGATDDFRDVQYAYYDTDDAYLYYRLECYGFPNFTLESDARYKWFIDTDDPHNMSQSGGNVYEAEYLFFVEDTDDDGVGDIYLLYDVDGDGLIGDDWPDHANNPGPINDSSIANYNVHDNYVDLYISLSYLSYPSLLFFTWATDQENPNLDQAPNQDRSDTYWEEDLNIADLSLVKTDDPDPAYAEGYLTYTLSVTNYGPDSAQNINVTDILPSDVSFNYANPVETGSNDLTYWWIIPSIDVGTTVTIAINVTIDSGITGIITNNADIGNIYSSTNNYYDPYPLNNVDSEDTNVIELNHPPVLTIPILPSNIDELILWSFTANATDPNIPAQTLTFSLEDGVSGSVPVGASIDGVTGVFTWTPTEDQGPGVYSFDVVVSDGIAEDRETIDVTVSCFRDK
jgi:uncharacterized repeat protein (TIGR01451 family)